MPNINETVNETLCRIIEILQVARFDDSSLLALIDDNIDIEDLSNFQRQNLRYQCTYLCKAYEIALQYMNTFSWTKCIQMALAEISDSGVFHIKNEKTIRQLNIQFRQNELFTISNQRNTKEPSIFTFFPESRTQFITFCNIKVKIGELSTEAAQTELTKVILPRSYALLLIYAGEEHRKDIPSYDDLLQMLGYKKINMDTIWRW